MAELRSEGLVRHLGVSNFTRAQVAEARRVVEGSLVTNQGLYHPYKDQSALLSFCTKHNIALTAYSPLARGAVLSDEVLTEIGRRHDKSAAQVALRWLVQQDGVVAIPKASSRPHLAANLDVFDFTLSDAERTRIREQRGPLGVRLQNFLPSIMRRLPFPPSV
jgi:diketogulonate reductase-like aldo/keto reductase